MRYRTLEIRWHDSKPISTCDFQPIPFKKARPSQEKNFASQSYKLATGGEDNHVRVRRLSQLRRALVASPIARPNMHVDMDDTPKHSGSLHRRVG